MTRYASDTTFEGDPNAPWWIGSLWAAHTALAKPILSPEHASVVHITRKDEAAIKHLVREFVRAIQARNEEALRATLTEELCQELCREYGIPLCQAMEKANPKKIRIYDLRITSYDITVWGLTIDVELFLCGGDMSNICLGIYPTQGRKWLISSSDLELCESNEEDGSDTSP